MSQQPIPVILDTDIGSDIDDAVALAYLLKQPRCELMGVTTVSGNVAQRSACAEAICKAAGRPDIPIHSGASQVLLCGPGQPNCPQYDAIRSKPHRIDWPANTAIDFLRQTIRNRPGDITLLSIGSLTNVALLFAVDPQIPTLLKGLVSMAGYFLAGPEQREWNILVDPIASSMVYNNSQLRPPLHLSVGLDVTMKCQMPAPEVRDRFTTPPLDVVREMAEVWFKGTGQITFHDPLAAALIFNPAICQYAEGKVTVPLDVEEKRQGRTLFEEASGGPHRIAKAVDPAAFFQEYFGVFR